MIGEKDNGILRIDVVPRQVSVDVVFRELTLIWGAPRNHLAADVQVFGVAVCFERYSYAIVAYVSLPMGIWVGPRCGLCILDLIGR